MSHFYSTTACTMIVYWPPEVAALIYEFALKTPAAAKKSQMSPATVDAEQLNEAREDSHDLIQEYLTANAKYQKILNDIDIKRQNISQDLALIAKTTKKLLDNPNIDTDVTLDELEKQNKKLKDQEPILDDLEKQLTTWRVKELETLKDKWEKHWLEHKKNYVTELIEQLKSKCNITLSELEKTELNTPTKNREELLMNLRNFYPQGLPKGWDENSDLFKLRALWIIGAYQSRTLTTTTTTAVKTAEKITKKAGVSTNKQHNEFEKLLIKIERMAEKLKQIFTLTERDRYKTAISAKPKKITETVKPEAAPEIMEQPE